MMGTQGEVIDPDRRLWSLKRQQPGTVAMLRCRECYHLGAMPIEIMIARFGLQMPLSTVLPKLRCGGCQNRSVEAVLMWLCEPGCRRMRG